jgi:hypothetical protein
MRECDPHQNLVKGANSRRSPLRPDIGCGRLRLEAPKQQSLKDATQEGQQVVALFDARLHHDRFASVVFD